MRPVSWWESVRVEKMQIEVRRGEFVTLLVNVGTHDAPIFKITELKFTDEGVPVLTSHFDCIKWRKGEGE